MSRKLRYTDADFYGVNPRKIEGLESQIKIGVRRGQRYSYIVLRDDRSIKWKIVPTLTHKNRVSRLTLLHRNRFGPRGFHVQCSAWGTPKGVIELVNRIEEHERYERIFDGDT